MVKLYDCMEKNDSKLYLSPWTKWMENLIIRPTSLKRRKIYPQSWYVRCHWPTSKGSKEPCMWSGLEANHLGSSIVKLYSWTLSWEGDSWWLCGHMRSLKTKSGLCTLKSLWEELSSTFAVNPVCPLNLWKHSCNCIDAFSPRKDPVRREPKSSRT